MNQTKKQLDVDAVLWDFDGTLANSAAKNIAITKQILGQVAPRLTADNLPHCLKSEADYHVANHGADHWRDLYRNFFGMNDTEIEAAGPLWESYQMLDNTPVKLFKDVADTVTRLSFLPQGICSANASGLIRQVLNEFEISSSFQSVIGYEDLPHGQQKPAPDGGLKCLQEIFGDTRSKTIMFVGDHIADVIFARGLKERLHPTNTIISVTVTHSGANPDNWSEQPDEVIESPKQLIDWITF